MITSSKSKPQLSIHLLSPDKSFQWCIALNGEVIHHIHNIVLFSKNIGYPDIHSLVKDNKVVISHPTELTNNDREKDTCLHKKISAYLFDNCEQFEKEYGTYYEKIIEECKKFGIKENSECEECYVLKRSLF